MKADSGHVGGMVARYEDASHEAVARRLLALRLASGLTQGVFARKCGATSSGWANYESALRRPLPDAAVEIRRGTGVPLDWIYLGDLRGMPNEIIEKMREMGIDPSTGVALGSGHERKRG